MIAEVTAAALMSENKQRAMPASVDSTPTSANQEDHVSMACHGARRLLDMTDNLARIIGIEALTAAQGVEFRAPLATSPALAGAIQDIRNVVPRLTDDRYMAGDLALAETLVADERLVRAVEAATPDAALPRL
ncbi:MAG: aromatic amino acid lyase [Alphaproteobacteria bacterium]|nr:aromatic amino acid lyase [Alphaproteobacteria bacterium]